MQAHVGWDDLAGLADADLRRIGMEDPVHRAHFLREAVRMFGAPAAGLGDDDEDEREGKHLRISIEGSIGAGKSTFLRILASAAVNFFVVPEPLSKWTNVGDGGDGEDATADGADALSQGSPRSDTGARVDSRPTPSFLSCSQQSGMNLLELFYQDSQRWGFTFQVRAAPQRVLPPAPRTP